MTSKVRGIRGAITVANNTKEDILEGTTILLDEIIKNNDLILEDICSIFFTVTPDLNQEFPAKSARDLGLSSTPLICMTEIPVEGALNKCIRVLMHYNTDKQQSEMNHLYLREASKLRPDLSQNN